MRFPSYEVWAWAAFLVVDGADLCWFCGSSTALPPSGRGPSSAGWRVTGWSSWIGAARLSAARWGWVAAARIDGTWCFIRVGIRGSCRWYPPLCLGFDVYVGVSAGGALSGDLRRCVLWTALPRSTRSSPSRYPLRPHDAKIAITKSQMKPTDVVLDIGCGTGSLALRLAGSAAQVSRARPLE